MKKIDFIEMPNVLSLKQMEEILGGTCSSLTGNCNEYSSDCTVFTGDCTGFSGNCGKFQSEQQLQQLVR